MTSPLPGTSLNPGQTITFRYTATDAAGNTITTPFTFSVHVASASSLVNAVNDGVASGKIAPALQGPLNGILSAAQAALNAGLKNLARSILLSFEAAVAIARVAVLITPFYAAFLIAWSTDLRGHI
ncbi:MAG: hypothetical protein WAQ33_11345 [Gaiellaceae bacterium]